VSNIQFSRLREAGAVEHYIMVKVRRGNRFGCTMPFMLVKKRGLLGNGPNIAKATRLRECSTVIISRFISYDTIFFFHNKLTV